MRIDTYFSSDGPKTKIKRWRDNFAKVLYRQLWGGGETAFPELLLEFFVQFVKGFDYS